MKTIMVDMDGVLCNDNFTKFLEEFLNRKIDLKNEKFYHRQDLIKGKEDEFRAKYQYENLYKNVELYDNCFEVLEKLSKKYKIYIVTAYVWDDFIISPSYNLKNKFEFLKEKLPFISPNNYIFSQNKKIMNFDIRIDDRPYNFSEDSYNILFSSYNNIKITKEELDELNAIRANDWKHIEEILLND